MSLPKEQHHHIHRYAGRRESKNVQLMLG